MVVAGHLGVQLGVLNNAFPVFLAPSPTIQGWAFWLLLEASRLLPVASGLLAMVAAVFRRTQRTEAVAFKTDRIWRAAGTGAIALWFALGAVFTVQIVAGSPPLAAGAPEYFSATFAVMMLLAASCLNARFPYWIVASAPIMLAATSHRADAYGYYPLQASLFLVISGLINAYFLSWVLQRSRRLDRAADAVSETNRKLSAARAQTVAKRHSEDFVHDEILATLSLVGKAQVDSVKAAALASKLRLRLHQSQQEKSICSVHDVLTALQSEIEAHEVDIELSTAIKTRQDLPCGVAQALISAIKQAIDNSIEHAEISGRQVTRQVKLECDTAGLRITVWDDGAGFDPAQAVGRHGLSNSIMRRASNAGIDVKLDTAPGRGTRLTFELAAPDAQIKVPLRESMRRMPLVLGGLALIAYNAFCLVVFWDAFTIPAASALSFVLVAGAIALLTRKRQHPMERREARYYAAMLVTADVLQSLTMIALPNSPDWEHWVSSSVSLALCLIVVWGYARVAWVSMAINGLALAWGTHYSGANWARFFNYQIGHLSQLVIWTVLALVTERTARQIDTRIKQQQELEAWLYIEDRVQVELARTRERISRRLSPLLARIEAGESLHPNVRLEAVLSEAELRDQLRAACFTGSRVPGAARRLRAAGADVILLDDSGGLLTTSERERIEAAVVPVLQELAAQLEGAQVEGGGEATSSRPIAPNGQEPRVVVRVLPASRAQTLVVTSDGRAVLALERAQLEAAS